MLVVPSVHIRWQLHLRVGLGGGGLRGDNVDGAVLCLLHNGLRGVFVVRTASLAASGGQVGDGLAAHALEVNMPALGLLLLP